MKKQIGIGAGHKGGGAQLKAYSGTYNPNHISGELDVPVIYLDASDYLEGNGKISPRWFQLNAVEEFAAGLLVMVEQLREENN